MTSTAQEHVQITPNELDAIPNICEASQETAKLAVEESYAQPNDGDRITALQLHNMKYTEPKILRHSGSIAVAAWLVSYAYYRRGYPPSSSMIVGLQDFCIKHNASPRAVLFASIVYGRLANNFYSIMQLTKLSKKSTGPPHRGYEEYRYLRSLCRISVAIGMKVIDSWRNEDWSETLGFASKDAWKEYLHCSWLPGTSPRTEPDIWRCHLKEIQEKTEEIRLTITEGELAIVSSLIDEELGNSPTNKPVNTVPHGFKDNKNTNATRGEQVAEDDHDGTWVEDEDGEELGEEDQWTDMDENDEYYDEIYGSGFEEFTEGEDYTDDDEEEACTDNDECEVASTSSSLKVRCGSPKGGFMKRKLDKVQEWEEEEDHRITKRRRCDMFEITETQEVHTY